jgi:hypothetical protein
MLKRSLALLALTIALGAGVFGAPAAAATAGASAVIADCNSHSKLTQSYSPTVLKTALTTMPASVKEYTNCYDVIQRALLAQLGGGQVSGTAPSSGSGSGGSFFSAPVIIVIGVLILAAGAFGVMSLRRRSA